MIVLSLGQLIATRLFDGWQLRPGIQAECLASRHRRVQALKVVRRAAAYFSTESAVSSCEPAELNRSAASATACRAVALSFGSRC